MDASVATAAAIVPALQSGLQFGGAKVPKSVVAPRRPSSTSDSRRWGGSENMAISEEEKNAESPMRMSIATVPRPATTLLETSAPP